MLEITCGIAVEGLLKRANKKHKLFSNSEFIEMDFLLEVGNITNLENIETRHIFAYEIEMKKHIEKFLYLIKKHNKYRIWLSTININNYMNLLYILNLIQKSGNYFTISLIDVKDVLMDKNDVESAFYDVTCCNEDQIKELLDYEKILTNNQLHKYLSEWDKLIREDSQLRVLEDGNIKSISEDYFDILILDVLDDMKETEIGSLIGKIMGYYYKQTGYISCFFLKSRIEKLIQDGKIKIIISKHDDDSTLSSIIKRV